MEWFSKMLAACCPVIHWLRTNLNRAAEERKTSSICKNVSSTIEKWDDEHFKVEFVNLSWTIYLVHVNVYMRSCFITSPQIQDVLVVAFVFLLWFVAHAYFNLSIQEECDFWEPKLFAEFHYFPIGISPVLRKPWVIDRISNRVVGQFGKGWIMDQFNREIRDRTNSYVSYKRTIWLHF